MRDDCEKRGVPVPGYLIPPDPLPGIVDWFLAFWELSTCRNYELGPIPWTAIQAWPVSADEADLFHDCIRDADRAYLEHLSKPRDQTPTQVLAPGFIQGKT